MILPFVLLFCVALAFAIRTSDNKMQQRHDAFWDREQEANHTRKKSLSDLELIKPDLSILSGLPSDEHIDKLCDSIRDICSNPVANLNYISNTDLKLAYGSANLPYLSECDANYTHLVQKLSELGAYLFEKGYDKEGSDILMYNLSIESDITRDFELLYTYFKDTNRTSDLEKLYLYAGSVNPMKKDIIMNKLK
ncbi:MAG TPA: hypothetical protein DCX21_06350 [Eubacterium sp.]|nr:hypothetical protein [Eubacterium sp.]HBZ52641.1 hypothetical protein [Eubacterium sp.]